MNNENKSSKGVFTSFKKNPRHGVYKKPGPGTRAEPDIG